MITRQIERLFNTLDLLAYVPVARVFGGSDRALACPECNDECVHPVAVSVLPAGAAPGSVTVTADGLRLDPTVPPNGRGVAITLSFACEQGHSFTYDLQFHKGSTLIRRGSRPLQRDDDFPRTIWRD